MVTRRVKFGYVDLSLPESKEITDTLVGASIVSTPTIYVYGEDKSNPSLYEGDYKFGSLDNYVGKYSDTYGYTDTLETANNPLNQGPGGLNIVKLLANAAIGGAFDLPDLSSDEIMQQARRQQMAQ